MTQITKCLRDTCMDIHIHVQVISARKARLLQLTTPILKGGFFKSNGEKIFLLFDLCMLNMYVYLFIDNCLRKGI